jgi:hypothetical protein
MTSSAWGEDWEARFTGRTCVICDALGGGDSDYWIHVADGACTEVHLDRSVFDEQALRSQASALAAAGLGPAPA